MRWIPSRRGRSLLLVEGVVLATLGDPVRAWPHNPGDKIGWASEHIYSFADAVGLTPEQVEKGEKFEPETRVLARGVKEVLRVGGSSREMVKVYWSPYTGPLSTEILGQAMHRVRRICSRQDMRAHEKVDEIMKMLHEIGFLGDSVEEKKDGT